MVTGSAGDRVNVLLEGNAEPNKTLTEPINPLVSRSTIVSDGYGLKMLEIVPPNLDTSGRRRYPVLVRVYGGPGSQMVSNRFEHDWHTYLSASQRYIVVVVVAGRRTGLKGRAVRNPVRDNLGTYEVIDQIAVAREMAKRRATASICMTCKTLEADSGIFTLGTGVASVTNWLYYDSVYTERYMSTQTANPLGYATSADVTSFAGDKVDFIWARGSGDDNVHYVNSASLLDKLTEKHVRGWRFRKFTDSNHSMDKRQTYREVYEWINDFLEEKWGKGGTIHH
ncbi:hypothetical protein IAT38_007211 [Cryptococcus sp. DSM 104549]